MKKIKKNQCILDEKFINIKFESRLEISNNLFEVLPQILNSVHDKNLSDRFWKMMVKDYVKAVVSRKSLLASGDLDKKPDLYPINSFKIPSQKMKFKKGVILFIKYLKTIGLISKIESVLTHNHDVYIGFPNIPNFEEEGLGEELLQYYPAFWGFGERFKRRKLNHVAEQFDNIFLRNVVNQIPRVLVEHFETLYNKIDLYKPNDKVFHVHFCESWFNIFLIAKYVDKGAKLIWYQHGYQTAPEVRGNSVDEGHEILLSYIDEYRSWGWSRNDKEVPWKAYRLEEFRINYEKYKNSHDYDILLCFPVLNNIKSIKAYKKISNTIISNTSTTKYGNILARPRRSNKLHSHASQLNFIQDKRVTVSSGLVPIMEEMSKCRIVIQMNIPSTNFLECLYVNHPTIGVLKNDKPSILVEPFYRFFLENGVFHHNFKSLVDHLNNIDIVEWWNDLILKPEYIKFKKTFLRNSK